jgi:hypothetical protein
MYMNMEKDFKKAICYIQSHSVGGHVVTAVDTRARLSTSDTNE